MNLAEWKESGLQLIKALRVRGEEESFRRLLSDLYPDTAHFIYELFQNAEDAKAELCRFTLSSDKLEFEHNGDRLFSEKDVKSITSFGKSTKRDDPTSIGKFGVGFKAVFAYTNTPEIHSGEFHFCIHDLVVYEPDGVQQMAMGERETRFIFPFNHPKKTPAKAVDEVEKGLRALGDNTLLFLSHIRKIEYRLPGGSEGSLERFEHKGGRIEIRACHPDGDSTISHWLRFQKDVEVQDEEIDEDSQLKIITKICRIAVAYSLEEDKKSQKSRWKIVPLDRGQVSIYFPAEKEPSNLRFHLHAPFASTVARDSVRNDCAANKQLRDHLADLVVESLGSIRDQGMLTVGFLAVLPNPADNLLPFYEPIREAIVEAFQKQDLTPMKRGGHAAADGIFRGPTDISQVIEDEDLIVLLGQDNYVPPLWAANPPQRNQREDRFLESLKIDEWGWSKLASSISQLDDDKRTHIEEWIAEKDDDRLMRFYALLGEACDTHKKSVDASNLCIVRVESDKGDDAHVPPNKASFPSEKREAAKAEFGIRFLKPTVYNNGQSEAQKKAVSFLEHIGVTHLTAEAEIKSMLDTFQKDVGLLRGCLDAEREDLYDATLSLSVSYIYWYINYWKRNPAEARLFNDHVFLPGTTLDDTLDWFKPTQLCLDSPYLETGLAGLSKIHGKYPVWVGYQEKIHKTWLKDFPAFLKAVGVMHELTVVKVDTTCNPKANELRQYRQGVRRTDSRIDSDYTIQGLENYIGAKTISAARLIWQAVIRASKESSIACYQPNNKRPDSYKEAESQLVYHLKRHDWIPDKTGAFRNPHDMTQEDLRTDFPYDDQNGLLTAIGFGAHAKKLSEEYQSRNKLAREVGFDSAEEAEEVARFLRENGLTTAEFRSIACRHKRASQPEESVSKPEKRRRSVLNGTADAPSRESIRLERSIQKGISEVTAKAKAYLRAKYSPDGQLICQCCRAEMPFKIRDIYYFEAVQSLRGLEQHHFVNRLSLCPTCAAKYQHARETDDVEIRRRIVEHDAPDTAPFVEIPVRLAGEDESLHFVGTHWFDLKTILNGTS